MWTKSTCKIEKRHCENCGETDEEYVGFGLGYSQCCNELIPSSQGSCRDHHGQHLRFEIFLDQAVTAAGYEEREDMIAADPVAWEALCARADEASR